jgi:hypothetical protein
VGISSVGYQRAVTALIGKKAKLVEANPVLVVPGSARTALLVTGEQYRWVPGCSNRANWQENEAGRSKHGASSSRFGQNSAASEWEVVLLGTSVQ